MFTDGSKVRVSEVPPHELNVRKFAESRASELEALHSVVADRLNNNFRTQRNKRRRTTGHDDRIARRRYRKRGRIGVGDLTKSNFSEKNEKKISRRVRRNIELKKNPQSGFLISGDGTKRLRTHVWHTKRFAMTKLWGFHIPLGLHGRGRGSRALLRKLKSGVLVHDASYYGTIQLEGPQESILSILNSVLVPSLSVNSHENRHDIVAGEIFGSAMLHYAGKQCYQPIAPVNYMWRPVQHVTTNSELVSINLVDEQQSLDDVTTIRQLWVWVHASAFKEAYDVLISASKTQLDTTGSLVQCISLEGQLAKLELMGSKAFELLQKTLLPVSSSVEKSEPANHLEPEKVSILKNSNQISSSAVIPFIVMDPRVLTEEDHVNVPEGNRIDFLRKCETKRHEISTLSNNETAGVVGCSLLWDASRGLCTPMKENIVCMEKHRQCEQFVRVGSRTSGTQNVSVEGNCRWCPILLQKHENHEHSIVRCSVILPLCWVKVFWNAFVLKGAHAIGLRERQWVASEIKLPCFPLDFPDCNAYTHFMAMEAAVSDQKARLRTPSKRPLEIPIPPPWSCNFREGSSQHEKSGECGTDDKKLDSLMKNPDGDSERNIVDCISCSFEGYVARTSSMLTEFMTTITGNSLFLFPRRPDQKNCMYKFMKDELSINETTRPEVEQDKGRCFLRVSLRAYKEGVFEQGAVVCAPLVADILSCTGLEHNNLQLQIPKSLLESYFVQLPSGRWDIQEPKDPAHRQFFRWPIGFITTGFVRESKENTAGALCEATLLSKLRMEQWRALPVSQRKKEIYVLVRNMRSTAYRLALATIVLEQDEDVDFI